MNSSQKYRQKKFCLFICSAALSAGPILMKDEIERTLRVLVGLPFWDMGRAATLQWFCFGEARTVRSPLNGTVKTVGEYALHLECAWRLTGPGEIIVASRDRYYPSGDPDVELPEFEWDVPGANRCDHHSRAFIEKHRANPLVVKAIYADRYGSLTVELSGDHQIEAFPDSSLGREYWRFFEPATEKRHFVVTGFGVEE